MIGQKQMNIRNEKIENYIVNKRGGGYVYMELGQMEFGVWIICAEIK